MSKMSRTKGQVGERELAALLSAELGVEIHRKLSASRDGGDDLAADGADDVLGWSIECKRTELFQSAFFAQAKRQADGKPWAVFWRRSRQPWAVFVDAHYVNAEAFPMTGAVMQMDLPTWCQLARERV